MTFNAKALHRALFWTAGATVLVDPPTDLVAVHLVVMHVFPLRRIQVRQHVNVFVNGERLREDADVAPDDRLQVLPSISGGCRP
jgi:hypothetical protein